WRTRIMQRENRLKDPSRRKLFHCRQSSELGDQTFPGFLATEKKVQQNLFVMPDRLRLSHQLLLAAIRGRFAKVLQHQAGIYTEVPGQVTRYGASFYLIG